MGMQQENVFLRPANIEDKKLLFEWRNDPVCRANSINTDLITYDMHCKWFLKQLKSKECNIFICMKEDEPIGQIRVNYEEKIGKVSYSVASEYRGRNYGIKMLELLEQEETLFSDIIEFNAVVKQDNVASQKCFEKMGYSKEERVGNSLIYYRKKLLQKNELASANENMLL